MNGNYSQHYALRTLQRRNSKPRDVTQLRTRGEGLVEKLRRFIAFAAPAPVLIPRESAKCPHKALSLHEGPEYRSILCRQCGEKVPMTDKRMERFLQNQGNAFECASPGFFDARNIHAGTGILAFLSCAILSTLVIQASSDLKQFELISSSDAATKFVLKLIVLLPQYHAKFSQIPNLIMALKSDLLSMTILLFLLAFVLMCMTLALVGVVRGVASLPHRPQTWRDAALALLLLCLFIPFPLLSFVHKYLPRTDKAGASGTCK